MQHTSAEKRGIEMNRNPSANTAQKYRFSVTTAAPNIREMMINFERANVWQGLTRKTKKAGWRD